MARRWVQAHVSFTPEAVGRFAVSLNIHGAGALHVILCGEDEIRPAKLNVILLHIAKFSGKKAIFSWQGIALSHCVRVGLAHVISCISYFYFTSTTVFDRFLSRKTMRPALRLRTSRHGQRYRNKRGNVLGRDASQEKVVIMIGPKRLRCTSQAYF